MSLPIALRSDHDAIRLRQLARRSKDAPQTRRLLALAVIYEGGSRTQAAEIGGVSRQTVRDWVLRFNAHGPDGLLEGKAPSQPSILSDAHRQRLSEMIESGPIPAVHGWSAGAWPTRCSGSGRSTGSGSRSRHSAVNCGL